MDNPNIVEETDDYAVVFKPAKTHSEMLEKDVSNKTILEWFYKKKGFKKEIKLMHRLDFETNGLVLFAKNEKSYLFLKELQDKGEFIKEYSAICVPSSGSIGLEGFPDNSFVPLCFSVSSSLIQSYFRPYGPGRKQVRPIVDIPKKHKEIAKDKGGFYQTEIIDVKDSKENKVFTVRIKRGFRHQIRCHLCWAGFPILNDPLYSNAEAQPAGLLALRSHALLFADPASGEKRECRIAALE